MEEILDAAIKALAHRHVFPLVMRRVELFHVETADLQRCIHIQVLVEWRYCARGLATSVIEFRWTSVLQFGYLRGFTVIDDELHGL